MTRIVIFYLLYDTNMPVKLLTRDVWQIKIVILLNVSNFGFKIGSGADDLQFVDPDKPKDAGHETEYRISEYCKLAYS